MSEQGGLQGLEQAAGVLLMLFIFVDVFVTVLYARANTGHSWPPTRAPRLVDFQNDIQAVRTSAGIDLLVLRPRDSRVTRRRVGVDTCDRRRPDHPLETRHLSTRQ